MIVSYDSSGGVLLLDCGGVVLPLKEITMTRRLSDSVTHLKAATVMLRCFQVDLSTSLQCWVLVQCWLACSLVKELEVG